jgi:hypothetical protein
MYGKKCPQDHVLCEELNFSVYAIKGIIKHCRNDYPSNWANGFFGKYSHGELDS